MFNEHLSQSVQDIEQYCSGYCTVQETIHLKCVRKLYSPALWPAHWAEVSPGDKVPALHAVGLSLIPVYL